jgi:hypothetical protein
MPKRRRVLLVTDATMKCQEQTVIGFFGHAPLAALDCHIAVHPRRSLRPSLPGVRYIGAEEARAGRYDRIVGFDANAALVELAAHHRCPAAFVGKVRQSATTESEAALLRLVAPIAAYTTHVSLPDVQGLAAFFGEGRWRLAGGIDFPPNVELHFATSSTPRFPFVLLGGGDRDYAFVLEHRDRIPGQVLVTHADAQLASASDRAVLARMATDPRFTLVPFLPPRDYARLLVHCRVAIMPVRGCAAGDYTSIADAAWYGLPVVTNSVRANAHMGGRVVHFEGANEFAARLHELQDADRLSVVSRRIRAETRDRNALLSLLQQVYLDL